MMTKEEWEKGLKAWENIKKQAEIDIEQAEMYIDTITKKVKEMK